MGWDLIQLYKFKFRTSQYDGLSSELVEVDDRAGFGPGLF